MREEEPTKEKPEIHRYFAVVPTVNKLELNITTPLEGLGRREHDIVVLSATESENRHIIIIIIINRSVNIPYHNNISAHH